MSDEQIFLDGTNGWVNTNPDFSEVTVIDASGDVATIARPLGGSLLGVELGFGITPAGAPYYDPIAVEPPDESAVLTTSGSLPALAPTASGGDIVTLPTS